MKLAQLNGTISLPIPPTYLFCRKNMKLKSRKLCSQTKYATNYYFLYEEVVGHSTSVNLDLH